MASRYVGSATWWCVCTVLGGKMGGGLENGGGVGVQLSGDQEGNSHDLGHAQVPRQQAIECIVRAKLEHHARIREPRWG